MGKILVIDDTMTDLTVTSSSLQKAGYSVMTAMNEQEAKVRLSSEKPDLIVLDVVLPDRSGFELCREIKDNAETAKIPVVMCSSKDSKMDKFWGLQQGADAYLGKPVDAEELIRTVRSFL